MANKPDPHAANKGKDDQGESRSRSKFQGLLGVGAGNVFASTVIAGFLLGFLVDRWLNTLPIFMLAFGLLGLIGGMRRAHRLMALQDRAAQERSSEDEQNKS